MGGNSLLLVTARTDVNRAFGTDLPVVDLFAHPTVRDLARHLSEHLGAGTGTDAGPARRHESAPSPRGALDRAKDRAQRQRAARARRSARHGTERDRA
ncbi:hypothetical protein B7767_42175 [Streptomyces sp. 13-12-16]|nr:hypothetical protein B7767_42175 [Streptomyces sp. 13-12-16]